MGWLNAIDTKQGMAPDHVLIEIENYEHAYCFVPRIPGSGTILYNTKTDLYRVRNSESGDVRESLLAYQVVPALEELEIINSSWV